MSANVLLNNEPLERALFGAARDGRPRQAYLFTGARGMGKKTLAYAFAKALLCERPIEGRPCNACPRCIAFDHQNNPDARFTRPVKKTTVGVDQIRALREEASVRPYYSGKKVFLIEEAERMTESAQNALLKTLEEPPDYAVFLLLAEAKEQLLQTIRSRVQIVAVRPVPEAAALALIRQRLPNVSPDYAAACAAASKGSVGAALALAASAEYAEARAEMAAAIESLEKGGHIAALEASERLSARKNIDDALAFAAHWFRDALAIKAVGPAAAAQKDMAPRVARYAATRGQSALLSASAAIEEARRRLSQSANARLTLDVLMIDLLHT